MLIELRYAPAVVTDFTPHVEFLKRGSIPALCHKEMGKIIGVGYLELNEVVWNNSFEIIEEIKFRRWDAFRLTNAPSLDHDARDMYIAVPTIGFSQAQWIRPLEEYEAQKKSCYAYTLSKMFIPELIQKKWERERKLKLKAHYDSHLYPAESTGTN